MRVRKPSITILLFASTLLFSVAAQAQDRRNRVDVEHYTIQAEVDPGTQMLRGVALVQFSAVDDNVSTVTFELNNALNVSKVQNGQGAELTASRNSSDFTVRVTLPQPLAKGKSETLSFQYQGKLAGSEESPIYGIKFAAIHNDFAYLMYPARWFPVNDYTVDRFTSDITMSVPQGFRVLGSGIDRSEPRGAQQVFTISQTHDGFPGSIAIVKGDPVRVTESGVTSAVFFRGEQSTVAQTYGAEAGRLMASLTGTFGTPPQTNLTYVETEDGTANGYAAPGLIFISPRAIGKVVNTRVLANQIARQWWGNSVSPISRNQIWIANAFPRWAELTLGSSSSTVPSSDIHDLYVESLTIDDIPVLQAGRLEDYSPEYWAITSAKATAVLSMLKTVMGDDAFAKWQKAIPTEYAGKAVSTDDLRKLAESISGKDLRGFFIQWFESTGAPEFKLEYTVFRTGKGFRIMGKIGQDLDTFRMPVKLKIETEGNPEEKTVEVVGTSSEFVVESFGRPKKVVIDPDGDVLRYSDNMRVAVATRRGEMFAEISEFSEALKEYQKALDVNRNSSLAHYRVAEVFFLQRNYQSAANEFREAINGDGQPKWTEVWSRINLGKIFDITSARDRAVNEYNLAIRTKDNTQGAQEEAAKYLKTPYERAAVVN